MIERVRVFVDRNEWCLCRMKNLMLLMGGVDWLYIKSGSLPTSIADNKAD
jgi:hypothetical protein